jgi:hypothetical protein
MVSMNRLTTEKRAQIVGSLVEGNSIRATVRMTGAAKNTVTKLLVDLGAACADYQDRTMRDLPCRTIQCDEIWAYCYSKQRRFATPRPRLKAASSSGATSRSVRACARERHADTVGSESSASESQTTVLNLR